MPDNCPFSKEFSVVIDYFVEKSIMSKVSSEDRIKRERGQALGIDFEAFYKIQKHNSLLLSELRDKLLGKRMIPKIDIFEDTQHSPDDKKERKKKKARKTYQPIKPVSRGSFSSILRKGGNWLSDSDTITGQDHTIILD